MDFFRKARGCPRRLGILPGTFNPVTIAHIGLAQAGLQLVDEVVLVLPRVFPHKPYTGASFTQRLEILNTAVANEPAISIAATGSGLFTQIAEACREAYGNQIRQSFLCGRDAAERVLGWDYEDPSAVPRMLELFDLLVADRSGEYQPPAEFSTAIRRLPLASHYEPISATEVRERMANGQPWEHLVPPSALEQVRKFYSCSLGR